MKLCVILDRQKDYSEEINLLKNNISNKFDTFVIVENLIRANDSKYEDVIFKLKNSKNESEFYDTLVIAYGQGATLALNTPNTGYQRVLINPTDVILEELKRIENRDRITLSYFDEKNSQYELFKSQYENKNLRGFAMVKGEELYGETVNLQTVFDEIQRLLNNIL